MSGDNSELALLNAAVAGNSVAFERLLLNYFSPLERYIAPKIPPQARRHLDVEDILQEVLSQAFRDLRHFEPSPNHSFYAWLRAMADHRLADALKRLGRKKRGGGRHQVSDADVAKGSAFVSLVELFCHDDHRPEQSAARRETEKMLHVAIAMLPDRQRDAMRAHYLNGRTIDDIAQQTGRTSAAIRGLIHRGKRNLAEAMGRSSRWLSSR